MDVLGFYRAVRRLKDVKRQGWVVRGVEGPESVSDHAFMVAVLCMVLPFRGDRERAVRMALVHDMAESEVGDIITERGWEGAMSRERKRSLEEEAMGRISSLLDGPAAGEMMSLWKEFEEGESPEAVFVRGADSAEAVLQALDYQGKGNRGRRLETFWSDRNVRGIKSESIKKLLQEIIARGV